MLLAFCLESVSARYCDKNGVKSFQYLYIYVRQHFFVVYLDGHIFDVITIYE